MTISELIEELKKYPQNTRIILHGGEGGYHDVKSLYEKEIAVRVKTNEMWCYGPHENGQRGVRNFYETALLIDWR